MLNSLKTFIYFFTDRYRGIGHIDKKQNSLYGIYNCRYDVMLLKRKPIRLFKLDEPKRFTVTKLDKFVVTVVFIVFIWAFYIDSFTPMLNETGEPIIIMTDRGPHTVPRINLQVFIAPIILLYEYLVLVGLDGKRRGRDLPWMLYFLTFKIIVRDKLREGMKEYREWKR